MAVKLSNIVMSLGIFATLIALLTTGWNGIQEGYTITETNLQNGSSVNDMLDALIILQGMNEIIDAGMNLRTPDANLFDLLGGLAGAGLGVVQISLGLITTPVEIAVILVKYYAIPSPVITLILFFLFVIVAFILVGLYFGRDL